MALEVIAELAGHADIRTSQGYITVAAGRCEAAITRAFHTPRPDPSPVTASGLLPLVFPVSNAGRWTSGNM